MLIVLPSDPATTAASVTLTALAIGHQLILIPESLGYDTGAKTAIYIDPDIENKSEIMMKLSTKGHVIMRVFKEFTL